jgi:AraC-like DNA-binding protein
MVAMPEFVFIGLSDCSGPNIRLHTHADTWEILFYTRGSGHVLVGGEPIPFTPGRIVFMPQGVEHGERSNATFACLFLHMKGYAGRASPPPMYEDDASGSAETLARMLNREFHLRQANWRRVTQELLDLLMLLFARWERATPDEPWVAALKAELVDNLHNPDFDVNAALNKLLLCPEHARRIFARATGKTPLQYLTGLRIEEAKQLLARGGLSVKEVAHRVGVPDPFYFSRMFRKSAGLAPQQYAERLENK